MECVLLTKDFLADQIQSKPSIVENLVASKLSTIEGLSTTEGLVYGDSCAILSTRWLYYTWLCILLTFITNNCNHALLLLFFSVALLDVFWIFSHDMPWCCFSLVKDCSWERLVWSLDKVVSQCGFFAQSLFTVLARMWLLTSVVLFMKRMFKSLDKVVSQRGSLAQSLVTVFARMWLLASVVLFMKKMFKSLHKVVSQRGYFAQSLVTVFARTWLLTSVALFMKKIVWSLDKVVSQRDFFAQSLVTVFALTWLLTSMSLIMRKIVWNSWEGFYQP